MRSRFAFIPLLILLAFAPAKDTEARRGWLLHLPGMGGKMTIDRLVTTGMHDGGVDAKIEIYDWTGEDHGLAALTNGSRHIEQSKIVAKMITRHARDFPNQPITLTAHSAGTGIAIWALEQLPDDVQIDDLVMIASALSPKYDLSKALHHVRHHAYAFNSTGDTLILSAGTKVFGTVDGVKCDAAGLGGFKMPDDADEEQYKKLEQIPYDPDWIRFDNAGEHIGAMMRSFAKNVIASVLKGNGLPPRATTRPSSRPSSQPATSHG